MKGEKSLHILVIDGQGGGVGRRLIEGIAAALPGATLVAVGTNSAATANMLKGGASMGATGENPVVVGCRQADLIAGPTGILMADAMYGEITPAMALAVGASAAQKVLVPVERCSLQVAGVAEMPMAKYIEDAVRRIAALAK